MGGNVFLVQVFRPEVYDEFPSSRQVVIAWEKNPFNGIEILGFCDDEDEVNALIDQAQSTSRGKNWKFHYEELPSEVGMVG